MNKNSPESMAETQKTSEESLPENIIAKDVVDAAFRIHSRLGPGLLETVYEVIMAYELRRRGYEVERQKPIPIVYDDINFEEGFRADLCVNNCVFVELKSVEELLPVHGKQVLTQIRLGGKRLGLLINFGSAYIKDGIERVVNGLPSESSK
jgi:GxxExxY protein